jgi:hypothetical protein
MTKAVCHRSLTAKDWVRGFDPEPVQVRFVLYKVALGQVFLRVLPFYPVSIIPPMLHINLHLHTVLTRRTNGQSLGTFQKKECSFGKREDFLFDVAALEKAFLGIL